MGLVQLARHCEKRSVAQPQVSQKVQKTSLQEVTWPRHSVTHALSVRAQRPSKVGPFSVGQRVATWALAAEQAVASPAGAHPRYLPPPQMQAPFEPHCGNGQ